jgi:hypothetical protein
MSSETKIMSDLELSIFQARRVANPDLLVDPVIVDRLMATALHYRNAVDIASEFTPNPLSDGRLAS